MDKRIINHKQQLGWVLAERGKPSILSIDVDNFVMEDVRAYIKLLQNKEDVGSAVIVESSDLHYHIYFFWQFLEWNTLQRIIQNCPIADPLFKKFTSDNNFIRMRISNLYKPYIEIIKHKTNNHDDFGDFYFKHYLFMVGFQKETIDYYMGVLNYGIIN